jgi:hypothetical protein
MKPILRVVAAGLVLVFFQLPIAPSSSGAFYSSYPPTQLISDPTGNTDNPGRDITKAFWAFGGETYFFRLALSGPFSNNNHYGIYFDTDNDPGTGVSFTGSGLTLSGIDKFVSEFPQYEGNFSPDGSFLPNKTEIFRKWKVRSKSFMESMAAPTKFSPSGLGTWLGATSNMGGSLKSITATRIPNTAWLFASGVLALIVLKRRRPKT